MLISPPRSTSMNPETTPNSDDAGERHRPAAIRLGREQLLRYVSDIIAKQKTPLRDVILDHALPRLPVQSLRRLLAVSAMWNRRISAPFFAHTQSQANRALSGVFYRPNRPFGSTAYLPFDTACHRVPDPSLSFIPGVVDVVAASNGLVACRSVGSCRPPRYYVCNPATAEWTAIPRPAHHGEAAAVALVFRPSLLNFSADYYLVCTASALFALEVFSSATGKWRLSNNVVPDRSEDCRSTSVNGVAYWQSKGGSVVSYDPEVDVFRVVGPPETKMPRWRMGEMDGKLCCVGAGEGTVEVHSLEGAVWRQRTVVVAVRGSIWPLPFEGREERVAVWVEGRVVGIELRSGTTTVVNDGWVPRECTEGVPYISSLVAVKELCSGDGCFTCKAHAHNYFVFN